MSHIVFCVELMTKIARRSAVGRLVSGVLFACFVFAVQPAAAQDEDGAELEEITVTGSRIQRSGFDTPTPVEIVSADIIEQSGYTNVYDILKSVPSIGVGLGSSNASPSGLPNPQSGASFVNLRGLGTDRSLVLVDGRRRVSGSVDSSAVDMSMIPGGLLERVEIITGGASAVYGADAVSGVVNLITKDSMEGLEVSVSGGASPEGSGGERVSLDLAGGTEFAGGRGSVLFGVSYGKEEELRTNQRDFGSSMLNLRPNPANTGPADGIPDRVHFEDATFFGFSTTGSFLVGGQWYTADPNVRLLNVGTPIDFVRGLGAEGFRTVDLSRQRQEQEVLATRVSLNYDLTDNIQFFIDTDFGRSETLGSGQPDNTTQGRGFAIRTIHRENPLIPADLAALMDANGLTRLNFNRVHSNWGFRSPTLDRTSHSIVVGLEGAFSNEWDWSVAYQDSRYENNAKWDNFSITEHVANAIDVIADPVTGEPVCRSRDPGCVPVYPLSQEPLTPEQASYLQHTVLRFHRNEQQIASFALNGDLFDLPAGEILFAAGLERREESIKTRDDGVARQGAAHLFRGQEPQDAESSVSEAYLEVVVPVLSELPFVEQLNVEAAIRVSDYDSIGETTASKFGINWTLTGDVRLRATSSISVRAPNLSELFSAGVATGAPGLVDPCTLSQINLGTAARPANCAALGIPVGWIDPNSAPAKQAITGGNPNLKEEESDSFTVGAVITPTAIEGLSVSIDYWNIEIDGAIGSFSVQEIIDKCVDSPTIDNAFCPQITREAPGPIAFSIYEVNVTRVNVGRLDASGIDFNAQYGFSAFNGDLNVALNGSFLIDHEELIDANDPTSLFFRKNDPDNPRLKSNLYLTYVRGPWSVGLNTRYIGSTKLDPNVLTAESIDLNDVPSRVYNDLIVGYEFDNSIRLLATVTNVGDVDPPRRDGGGIYLGTRGHYDNFGRFISLRASYVF